MCVYKAFFYFYLILLFSPLPSLAMDNKNIEKTTKVPITENLFYIDVIHNEKTIRIEREQNRLNRLDNSYTKTSRVCPPFCIQPQQILANVKTVAELELLDFIENKLKKKKGLMIDGRINGWYQKATIPGSINLPFTLIDPDIESIITQRILTLFGAYLGEGAIWHFSDAQELLIFGNGSWGDQSARAIKNLLYLGYPPEKIAWYRGGIQSWLQLGLTVVATKD